MTGIDLAAVLTPFANLAPAGRVELAGQVADRLERLLEAGDDQGVALSEVQRAHVMGAVVALRAVAG